MKYMHNTKKSKNKRKILIISIVIFLVFVIGLVMSVRVWYQQQLNPFTSSSFPINVTIDSGSTPSQIANLLESKKVIKNAKAFEWYLRNKGLGNDLQAGEYNLDSSQSVPQIVDSLVTGKVQKNLFTILPGQRLDQIKKDLLKVGYDESEVNIALNPATYKNHPALVTKPTNASLEGYLYPDSFQTTSSTTPKEIIEQSLDAMAVALTPELINQFQKQGLSPYQGITLASVVEQEVPGYEDRRMVAQVFLNRLKTNMALGSDVTFQYAAAILGVSPSPSIDSPYNTRKYPGLPPGPISNVTKSVMEAVANPSPNSYLFFVAGDDGKTYYANTNQDHEANTKKYCTKLCQ
jgi:UPF0755 protein